ncbi:phosphatidylserine decarboxylase [Corallincola holothuriorum]|uniref:Phosphatidylserine decarboxylase proenzyme n=1 Tax=Corallincola holothuriorum TaxID=2282215 RepID=A0A368NN27_9GAMM|nr:archaetidylserine decarboxylase [Corallincola holothuriorum]RCU51490.1 phosphatidylserine decarboxylase [Corallincola holothuriorum]
MLDKLKVALQYCFPQHGLSRLVGWIAAAEAGKVTTAFIRWFIGKYQVNMSEAVESAPEAYSSFNQFFTRPLKEGVRPLDENSHSLVHPVDGTVSQLGPIEEGRIFQAKGFHYTSTALLGGDPATAEPFNQGDFATIYLAPRDYHRMHMPLDGTLKEMIYVPGKLFSVNPLTAENVPELFARNERVVAIFDTEVGPMAMVLVGATIVASIETVWAGTVTPPAGKQVFRWTYPAEGNEAVKLKRGEEMGRFKLGSTVVMLFGKDAINFNPELESGVVTRMGEAMASRK